MWFVLKLWAHCFIHFHCDVRVWSKAEMMYLCYYCNIKALERYGRKCLE